MAAEEGRPAYLSRADDQAQTVLTERMVEQGYLMGTASSFCDEDFRYSHTFGRLAPKSQHSNLARNNVSELLNFDDEEVKEEEP